MQKKYVFLYFLFADWSIDPRKHLLKEVIKATSSWSDAVLLQQPVCILGHIFTKFRSKIVGLLTGKYKTKRIEEGALLFTPIILFNYSLWLRFKIIASIDIFLFKLQYKRFINKYFPKQKIVLWLFYNRLYPLLKHIKHDFIVYDYQDNFDYRPDGTWSEIDAEFNELLIKRSDYIVCTGKVMYERAKKLNKHAAYIQNGNNFEVLSGSYENKLKEDIYGSDKKIIGYLGGIRKWLDFDLLEKILIEFPHALLVSIGLVYRDAGKEFNRLKRYPNFYWLNYMEPEKLPSYINNFDVGIIPFKVNKFMEGVFPNKFFEYMASGIPIVTTALPELEMFSEYIGYAKNNKEFIKYLSDFLDGDKKVNIEKYKNLAYANSWKVRAEVINSDLVKIFDN